MKNHGMVQNKMLNNKVIKKLLFLGLAIFSVSALAVAVPDPIPEPVPTPVPAPAPTGTTVISFQYDAMGNRISQKNPSADIDGDGISDLWEITYFGNLNHDMSGDTDNDGLTDLEEYQAKTNPTLLDTDEDGIADGYELNNGMNPLDGADALVDTDNDGLPDTFEIFHGLNINDPNDVNTDNDGDGFTVWQEFYANTSDMDDTDKPTHSLLSFEDNAHERFYWLPQDNDAWLPDSNHSSGGGFSLRSSTVSSTTPTKLEVIINATGEPISFDVLGTEFFHQSAFIFYIDGEVKYINGFKEEAFNHLEFDLTPGKHRLTWYYGPLNYEVVVDDSFYIWLDNIVLPTVADSDSDGFKDSWEYLHFDSLSYGPTNDVDNDGLTNLEELNASTNPNEYDTDGDGKADGFELSNGMNPLDPLDELLDSDNDGLPDAFEIFHGLNINDASDANIDSDGDGYSILQEYLAGTSDTDPNEQPSITVDFEAGKISPFYWQHSADLPWQITQVDSIGGNYSLQAGKVLDNQQSRITLTINATGLPLSFDFKLATGSTQGKFEFYIDGIIQDAWIGSIDSKRVEYPLLAGKRKLAWVYTNSAVPTFTTTTNHFSSLKNKVAAPEQAIRAVIDNINIPAILDIDNDGVDDSWEYLYFDSLAYDLSLDTDDDGLSNLEEYQTKTNPTLLDTDEDGIPDGYELNNGMNPLDAADALVDTDNDGLPDTFEIFHGLNINDPSDAATDNDGDGFTVLQEFLARTSDHNNADYPPTLIDFESGELTPFYWSHNGASSWQVTNENTIDGQYSLQAGDIASGESSSLAITIYATGSPLSFDLIIETVQGRIDFYIDDVLQGLWSGNYQQVNVEYPLSAGKHQLKWVYQTSDNIVITTSGISEKNSPNNLVKVAVYVPTPVIRAVIDNIKLPVRLDFDNNSVDDTWQYLYFDSLSYDLSQDFDNDGLSDLEEYLEKSNPTLTDTDGDNMADGWEKSQGLNLLLNDAAGDINGDGRINLVEYIIDTPDYPVDIDSDGDGVPDVVEVQMGSNPTDPTSMEHEINIITGTSLGDQLVGSNEADQILGLGGDDVIVGGLGNDEFDGGLGKDTFKFSLGDGHDVIKDTGGIDIIVFDASITAEMLSFTQKVEANLFTLIISINNSTDQIDIQNWKKNSFDKLAQIVFADGTTWSNSDIENKVVDILSSENKILAPKYISGQLNRGRYRFPIEMHYSGNTSNNFAGLVAPSTVLGHVQADDDGQFTIEDIGLGIHHFEIPTGSKIARFSLRDESVTTEGSDLDLYVYQCKKSDCNKLVGKSININSNEDVILLNPEVANNQSEGDYYAVYVYGHSTGVAAGTDYSMSVWVADKAETTTRVLSSRRALEGRSNYVTVMTRGLEFDIIYMGAVTFYNDLGVAEGTTVLEFHTVE